MKRVLFCMAVLAALLSCSKEREGATTLDGTFDFSVSAELPEMQMRDNTKATTQYTVRIKWAAGDKLSVINLTTGKILGGNLKANSSGNVTTFSGTLSGTITDGDVVTFLYPGQDNASEEVFTSINVDMSAQTGTTGGVPLCVYSTSIASSTTFNKISLTFSYLMGYMMIGMSDIPSSALIKSVTLTNVTDSFKLSINAGKTGFDIAPHVGDIVLSPNQTASATGVKTVYAAIPGSAAATRSAILETGTTTFFTTFSSAKLNNGYAYNTNVSGFLMDDLMPEDPKVREYCLAHFDVNGDGKLSMVEIAGVTSFPEPLPSGIVRFNELQYFYGLTELPSFKNQNLLESVTIPSQITSIPDEMFYGCSNLMKVVVLPGVPPTLGSDVFYGQNGNFAIVVPEGSLEDYLEAEGWRDYYNNFRGSTSEGDSSFSFEIEGEDMEDSRIEVII